MMEAAMPEVTMREDSNNQFIRMIDPDGFNTSLVRVSQVNQALKALGMKHGVVGEKKGEISEISNTVVGAKPPPPDPLIARYKDTARKAEQGELQQGDLEGLNLRVSDLETSINDISGKLDKMISLMVGDGNSS